MKEAKAREGVPVVERSKCKGPEVGKKLVCLRARKKATMAATHRGRRVWYERRLQSKMGSRECHAS